MDLDLADEYRRLYPALVRFCSGLCRGDAAAGEDMAQEVFLRTLQSPVFWELPAGRRRAWLYTAARRLAADRGRRAGLEQRRLGLLHEPECTAEPAYAAVEVAALLACLPPQDRQLFALRYLAGYSAADLADRLGQPAATVRARLRRLRRRLAQIIQEE